MQIIKYRLSFTEIKRAEIHRINNGNSAMETSVIQPEIPHHPNIKAFSSKNIKMLLKRLKMTCYYN